MSDDAPRDQDLTQVADLANLLLLQEDQVAEATTLLQTNLEQYRYTAETLLPEAMDRVGLSEFTLSSGKKVKIDSRFRGTKVTDHEALTWLEENGGGNLIKATVKLELPASMLPIAREILHLLQAHRASNQFTSLSLDTSVHQSTIAAFVKEQFEAGYMPPMEQLGVSQKIVARVGDRRFRDQQLTGFIRKDY